MPCTRSSPTLPASSSPRSWCRWCRWSTWAAVALYAALRYTSDLSGFRVGATMVRGMYHRLGEHLARLPLGWHSAGRVGEVSVLAGEGVLRAMSVIAHLLAPFISACVTPLTIVAVMLAFNWQLGLAALVAAPIVAAIQIWTARSTAATDAQRHERDTEATGRVIEYLQAQPVLRAGGRSGERFTSLDDSLREVRRASRRTVLATLPGTVGLTLTVQAIFAVLLVLGTSLALGGTVGAAEILTILVLAARSADPLLSLADIGGKVRGARAELARLDTVLRTEPLPEAPEPIQPAGHGLEFESVTFRHGDRTVLEEVSLSVPQGQRVAVVGASGAGKSTLLQLPARFHDVDAGAVRVGGVDVRAISTEVTSALDPVNEAAVHEGIERLMAGRTVVMVAHRMRTVRRADRIVFLDGGRIVEEGSHDELLRHGGRYADFWNISMTPAARE
ncbi:ATP-binding cassette, subfamily B [Streptosporangium canum]|uniref:ATP-binding cassette, subfamily B n=2 Tax=Streptosporangium canum TaxID=324952 RepID=A0A1I3K8H1_9ACTN|nr:ABC transporter ATP-binding protein [Streptosporangium canum]SFI68505.1 ATP-binding cassette, subfamily B [Streptosporangium canum]